MRPFARRALFAAASFAVLAAHPALAAAPSYTTPNVDTTPSGVAETTTLDGVSFTSWGLVGTGRLSAQTVDFLGDTLGSFSGMAIDRSTWRVDSNGTYSFSMYTLPDRGRNDPSVPLFFDYPARLNAFDSTFTPYSGADLPASTGSQDQLTYDQTGGIELTDFNGNPFTGADPAAGTVTQNGFVLPSPTSGTGAGKVSLDAEAVTFRSDGSFYVSDEYAASIYYFDASGRLQGVIQPPKALLPFTAGNLNYNSLGAPTDGGRRNNQGLEGVSLTPDGKYLIAVLQSATVQDTANSNQANRSNTRVLVYDVSGEATPENPVGHYVLQLPTYTFGGTGGTVNRTAAQSEILAINDYQFLTLARDGGTGLGTGATNNLTYRSILLVDTRGATNLAGTTYETSYTPVDTLVGGSVVLDPSIAPVSQTELVNMLNPTQLATFGLTTSMASSTNPLAMSEKWEGMSLMPMLDEKHPQDFLLFVSNDNDYVSTACTMSGTDCSSSYDNDNMILVYHVTLPTAVDPLFYDYMIGEGAATTTMAADAGISAADEALSPIQNRLGVLRGAMANGGSVASFNVWGSGLYSSDERHHDYVNHVEDLRGTAGIDANLGNGLIVGGALGFGGGRMEPHDGFRTESKSVSLSVYGTYDTGSFFASAAYGYLPWIDFSKIERPAAYGLTATGDTKGTAQTAYGEVGYMIGVGGMTKLGPVASLSYLKADIDGYTEHGAAGGNIAYPDRSVDQTTLGLGGEIIVPLDDVTLTGHAAYEFVLDKSDDTVNLALASVAGGLGGASVTVPTQNEDDVRLGVGAQGSIGKGQPVGWLLGYDARIGKEGGVGSLLTAGLNIQF
ncbi:esterase-like activity of phytase family protein [Parvibaculum sp.]|uniref:esterase-like activity of phytase family protein n=1 Tax=Parvibaculum sp. TaxID=2024848 RepID=UPI002B8438A3|nr:esterase-like activity of phytase family protein [Parvibaculum sp.]HUD51706.1 esterase-like activity of phytase family protein [Parvibaculum sp.]